MEIKINSLKDLENFAKKLAKCLKGNEIILLKGNLAAGKTTFTRYLVLSIDPEAGEQVNSPTFSIMNEYETSKFPVYHIDLYRVKSFDFSDVLGHGVVIIEWAEEKMMEELGNLPVVFIDIRIKEDEKRILKIKEKNTNYILGCIRKGA